MTELENMECARSYILKLANGINPLTQQMLPDTDIVNNVKVSRCLFYVSDVLRQVIEKGGVSKTKEKKAEKMPFYLSYEERQKFEFSNAPIPITELTKRINELIAPEKMRKLSYKSIAEWLIEVELLTSTYDEEGKSVRRPTPKGLEFGILTERRQGQNRVYIVTLYNREAQQFILDNLDAVIELLARDREKQ